MSLKTITEENGVYFLTSTVIDWVDVFTRPSYKHIFIDSVQFCQQKKGLELYAWVLMSNHFHAVVAARQGFELSGIIRDLKKYTSKSIIHEMHHGIESRRDWMLNRFEYAGRNDKKIKYFKFWQEGNYPKQIITGEFLRQKINYIHNNPVKAEYVFHPEHYLYSSAVDYAGEKGMLDVTLAW